MSVALRDVQMSWHAWRTCLMTKHPPLRPFEQLFAEVLFRVLICAPSRSHQVALHFIRFRYGDGGKAGQTNSACARVHAGHIRAGLFGRVSSASCDRLAPDVRHYPCAGVLR